jgi:glycosyltransferase involved in cell wall biosynthesis
MSPPPVAIELIQAEAHRHNGAANGHTNGKSNGHCHTLLPRVIDAEQLRHWAWVIGEQRAGELYVPTANHVGLGMVTPMNGFAQWRIHQSWVEETARSRGNDWNNCALVLRLYDVSYILFNGMNAHSMIDIVMPSICGHMFFRVPRPGTCQLGEVGFRLRNGEFIPAARSQSVQFPRDTPAPFPSHAGLLVEKAGTVEEIDDIWEQEQILQERRKPTLRPALRIAAFAWEWPGQGHPSAPAKLASELALGQARRGHEVHLFVPASTGIAEGQADDQLIYHPLEFSADGSPLDCARNFAAAAEACLSELQPFDLFHIHEWMAGLIALKGNRPTVFSLTSVEAVRCNGTAPGGLYLPIRHMEREIARTAGVIILPDHLHARAITELDVEADRLHMFPMEARLPDEWDTPLDFGHVKMEAGFGPLDRMIVFVGPLEHSAGVDLLIEALPTAVNRARSLRVAFVGTGSMHDHLLHRAHQLGVGWAVRFLGHVERPFLVKLMRACEALMLPSRFRVPWDDAVVDFARLAGRPVVTTHSGPSYLVKHELDGVLTYDNPGSMVWAFDRILQDPGYTNQMGRNGKRVQGACGISWDEVTQQYLDLCAISFPELRPRRSSTIKVNGRP